MTQLLIAARDGDHDALTRFIRATQADVWRMCHHLGDPDSADDLAQETYERAISSLHRYRADGPARSWILTIARRTCADGTRRRARRRRLGARLTNEHSTTRPGAATSAGEVDERVTTAGGFGRVDLDDLLARLGDDRRDAFVLTQVLGLSYAEAAEIADCPVGTVRSRVARARADLLAMIAPPSTVDTSDDTGDDTGDGTDG